MSMADKARLNAYSTQAGKNVFCHIVYRRWLQNNLNASLEEKRNMRRECGISFEYGED